MPRPFELEPPELRQRLDEMVDTTFGDLQSQFLVMPKGNGHIEYADFQAAYEVLKRHTDAFVALTEDKVWDALEEDALALVVIRTILGLSPPEWADLAKSDRGDRRSSGCCKGARHEGAARACVSRTHARRGDADVAADQGARFRGSGVHLPRCPGVFIRHSPPVGQGRHGRRAHIPAARRSDARSILGAALRAVPRPAIREPP
jgi:hypothetical protein